MGSLNELVAAPAFRFRLPKKHRGVLSEEERALVLAHVELLASLPTAPYAEDATIQAVREFVRGVPGLRLRADRYQNLIVSWPGSATSKRVKTKRARSAGRTLAFSAHLDHPGFLYRGTRAGVRRASFHGGVPERFFPGAPVRFFDPQTFEACATARVARTARDREKKIVAELSEFRGRARRGMFGMWDLTPGSVAGTRYRARVCDDLLGASALLSTLELLAREGHPEPVVGILTRAEETGFIGCQGLLRSGARSARKWAVIGLECSPRRATAKVGGGPVLRVGDAGSIFEPELTHLLQEVASGLRREHPDFVWQRALMDGGRCESSAYNLWGVPAGGLCLALGNYHNCAPNGGIEPEYVDWNDHEGLVALMVAAARGWRRGPVDGKMRRGLDRIWGQERGRLLESARRIAGTDLNRSSRSSRSNRSNRLNRRSIRR